MTEPALVELNGVSKKYCRHLRKAIRYGLADLAAELTASSGECRARLRPAEFWALDGVQLSLRRGECLGVVGGNGAGKSTLLKLLAGVVRPDRGEVVVRGRVGTLLDLRAGFHPLLSGRENVLARAAVLGMPRKQARRLLEEILAFAELGDHAEAPVQSYSAGMKVRLGFAVAAHLEPDVLLIDEVLAVGDVGFTARCLKAVDEMRRRAAVVLVSHSLPHVARIADRVLVLDHGRPSFQGNPGEGLRHYLDVFPAETGHCFAVDGTVLESLVVEGDEPLLLGSACRIRLALRLPPGHRGATVALHLLTRTQQVYAQTPSFRVPEGRERVELVFDLPELPLTAGRHVLSLGVRDATDRSLLLWNHAATELTVAGSATSTAPLELAGSWRVEGGV